MEDRSYKQGYRRGLEKGRSQGFQEGFKFGYHQVRSQVPESFDGTSIIIPTYNNFDFLKKCVQSIEQFTPEPHELIIVDNASTDGTREYLKQMAGRVKFVINSENLGFAGAINQGLAIAGGSTLLLLNNDTIVTKNWLSNLLTCVYSSEKVGLVGPVTNYISGEQLIKTSYEDISQMHQFASQYNVSDASRWVVTGNITGFCLLLRREVFTHLGYMDEGFEIGNCEDDDYALRTQLAGYELVIAKDTFIHHEGSVSMKALGDNFDQVYGKNLEFYSKKWEDSHSLLQQIQTHASLRPHKMTALYPSHVLVKAPDSGLYWIENGVRRALNAPEYEQHAAAVSRLELAQWPEGSTISAQELTEKLQGLEGSLIRSPDGAWYQLERLQLRRITSSYAMDNWKLANRRLTTLTSDQMNQYAQGLPIIPQPVYKANNL